MTSVMWMAWPSGPMSDHLNVRSRRAAPVVGNRTKKSVQVRPARAVGLFDLLVGCDHLLLEHLVVWMGAAAASLNWKRSVTTGCTEPARAVRVRLKRTLYNSWHPGRAGARRGTWTRCRPAKGER